MNHFLLVKSDSFSINPKNSHLLGAKGDRIRDFVLSERYLSKQAKRHGVNRAFYKS